MAVGFLGQLARLEGPQVLVDGGALLVQAQRQPRSQRKFTILATSRGEGDGFLPREALGVSSVSLPKVEIAVGRLTPRGNAAG